jgi:adenosylcobinamide-GDP ribazoletransferase
MRSLLSFFTTIPAGGDLEGARQQVWLLPLLGVFTSSLPALILYLKPANLMVSLLSLLTLYIIIGIIHLDGLADLADALAADSSRRLKVLKSPEVGTAGMFAISFVLLLQSFSLFSTPFYALIASEINSKTSMVFMLRFKRPLGNGMGRFFMEAMNWRKFFSALFIYLLIIASLTTIYSHTLFSPLFLLVPVMVGRISIKTLGGINGDCMGASAELTRAASLLGFALMEII